MNFKKGPAIRIDESNAKQWESIIGPDLVKAILENNTPKDKTLYVVTEVNTETKSITIKQDTQNEF